MYNFTEIYTQGGVYFGRGTSAQLVIFMVLEHNSNSDTYIQFL